MLPVRSHQQLRPDLLEVLYSQPCCMAYVHGLWVKCCLFNAKLSRQLRERGKSPWTYLIRVAEFALHQQGLADWAATM